MPENAFLECMTNIKFFQSCTKIYIIDICYIALYSISIVFGITSFSRYWKMRKLPTQQWKRTMFWGANTAFFLQLGGKQRNWVGNCPLVYMLKEALGEDLTKIAWCKSFEGFVNYTRSFPMKLNRFLKPDS